MLGFYNYTMLLTYSSLISASLGIIATLGGKGHPFIGIFFLMFSGLCDAFDGKVARTKKNRSTTECKFGIQVDSLSDLVAFGVLPACIGVAFYKNSPFLMGVANSSPAHRIVLHSIISIVLLFYVLTAMIRLAYFNVTEEERQETEGAVKRKFYTGLPVTSASIIFPTVALFRYLFITDTDISILFFIVMAITAIAFVSKLRVRKPGIKAILVMVGIGVVEFLLILLLHRP